VFLPQFGGQYLNLVAVGPNGHDLEWTHRVLKALNGRLPWGLSAHYYVSGGSDHSADGDALNFSNEEFYLVFTRAHMMDGILRDQWAVIQEVDVDHKIKLVVDEWGASYGGGSKIGPKYSLSQVPTVRDALVTGFILDTFHRHADKVALACVAQTINCLHSLMLAREDKFVITPIYNVFKMYLPHIAAQSVRAEFTSDPIDNPLAQSSSINKWNVPGYWAPSHTLPGISGSASIRDGKITLTVVNANISRPLTAEISILGKSVIAASGLILESENIHGRHGIPRRDRNHHLYMVGQKMPFLDPTLFLLGQLSEHLAQMSVQISVQHLAPKSRDKYNMVLALPLRVA